MQIEPVDRGEENKKYANVNITSYSFLSSTENNFKQLKVKAFVYSSISIGNKDIKICNKTSMITKKVKKA